MKNSRLFVSFIFFLLISFVGTDEQLASEIEFLKNAQGKTWEQIKDNWDHTYNYRKQMLLYNSLDNILNKEWPLLNSKLGPQLVSSSFFCSFVKLRVIDQKFLSQIEYDFQKAYPNTSNSLYEKWEAFFEIVYELKKNNVKEPKGNALCEKYNYFIKRQNELGLDLDGLRLLLLPHLIPLTGSRKTGAGLKRFSIEDSSNGFILWSKVNIFTRFIYTYQFFSNFNHLF